MRCRTIIFCNVLFVFLCLACHYSCVRVIEDREELTEGDCYMQIIIDPNGFDMSHFTVDSVTVWYNSERQCRRYEELFPLPSREPLRAKICVWLSADYILTDVPMYYSDRSVTFWGEPGELHKVCVPLMLKPIDFEASVEGWQ